jgi:hypothetical protein
MEEEPMKTNRQLPVKKEIPYESGSGGWGAPSYAFTIAFVYPQKGDAYVVKGPSMKVHEYLKKEAAKNGALLYNLTVWNNKKVSEQTYVCGLESGVTAHVDKIKPHGTRRFCFRVTFGQGYNAETMIDKMLRRRPRKWLKDLDAFVAEKA